MSTEDPLRPTFSVVRLDNLQQNYKWLRSLGISFLCPMVKANAYGHGDDKVVTALEQVGCQHVGVATVDEGVHLRKAGIECGILIFDFFGKDAVQTILENNLTAVVSDQHQLEQIANLATQPAKIHLKFNTGMNRLGFPMDQASSLIAKVGSLSNVQVAGVCTHFLNGEDFLTKETNFTKAQLESFKNIVNQFNDSSIFYHAYNSAAAAAVIKQNNNFHYGCRPGLLIYGIDPIKGESLKPLISPVMEFHSKIVTTQRVKLGGVVSYGGTWQAKRDSIIGIVPAGYADGICRSLSNRGEVLVNGTRVPITGTVCMDYIMVDLTDLNKSEAQLVGNDVVLIGQQGSEQITVEEVAETANRISYEIVTGISGRVPRIYGEG